MIGINTMIVSTSGSSAGIGFAVPVDTARRVVADLIQYGSVRRGGINAVLVQLTPAIAQYAKLDVTTGLLVSEITKGSQATRAGLKAGTEAVRYGSSRNAIIIYLGGDVITEIAGVKMTSLADYYSVLESRRPGDTVSVRGVRGKTTETLTVTLEEPEEKER
jgi:S1-C subfamily serine protease